MANNGPQSEALKARTRLTFGQLAVRKGYASQDDVKEALRIQRQLDEHEGKHKLIGMIMLEMGVLGTTELIDILKDMERSWVPGRPARPAARAVGQNPG